jgi:hypothetical protein
MQSPLNESQKPSDAPAKPGANPATAAFTTTTLALCVVGRLERFLHREENVLSPKRTRLLEV